MSLEPHTYWWRVKGPKHERGRKVIVLRVNGHPWNSVEYRYLESHPGGSYSRTRGLIRGRTNTTCMSREAFLKSFEFLTSTAPLKL